MKAERPVSGRMRAGDEHGDTVGYAGDDGVVECGVDVSAAEAPAGSSYKSAAKIPDGWETPMGSSEVLKRLRRLREMGATEMGESPTDGIESIGFTGTEEHHITGQKNTLVCRLLDSLGAQGGYSIVLPDDGEGIGDMPRLLVRGVLRAHSTFDVDTLWILHRRMGAQSLGELLVLMEKTYSLFGRRGRLGGEDAVGFLYAEDEDRLWRSILHRVLTEGSSDDAVYALPAELLMGCYAPSVDECFDKYALLIRERGS